MNSVSPNNNRTRNVTTNSPRNFGQPNRPKQEPNSNHKRVKSENNNNNIKNEPNEYNDENYGNFRRNNNRNTNRPQKKVEFSISDEKLAEINYGPFYEFACNIRKKIAHMYDFPAFGVMEF